MNERGTLAVLTMLLPLQAFAGKRTEATDATKTIEERGPVASASEIPALARLLEKANWTATPELSGVFRPGAVFEDTGKGHVLLVPNCIAAQPEENTYTSTEVVSSLQAGVSTGFGGGSINVSGELMKKVKFSTPVHLTIPSLALAFTDSCYPQLYALPADRVKRSYVIREVLRAEIAEQTCGRLDAGGRFVGLGAAEATYSAACSQESKEPVIVAYRTVPLAEVLAMPPTSPPTVDSPTSTPEQHQSVTVHPQPLSTGPFLLALAPQGGTCVWSVVDAPSGRTAVVNASAECPEEITWTSAGSLFYNDGDQVFLMRADGGPATAIMRPDDPRCSANGIGHQAAWGTPYIDRGTDRLSWSCFSEADSWQDLGPDRCRLCSGGICTDNEYWGCNEGIGIDVVIKIYGWAPNTAWTLDATQADCSGTEGCLGRFNVPPEPTADSASVAGIRYAGELASGDCTAVPESVTEDPSLKAMMKVNSDDQWICGTRLRDGGYLLWKRISEFPSPYGPLVTCDSNCRRRVPVYMEESTPLSITAASGWAVAESATPDGGAFLINGVGSPFHTWPAGSIVTLLPPGTPLPLGITP